jgi:hypothetical protein
VLLVLSCAVVLFVIALWLGWIERLRLWSWRRYWKRRGGWSITVSDEADVYSGDELLMNGKPFRVMQVLDGTTLTIAPISEPPNK